jgi:ribonucleoside-diphosphate reductase beta chain
MKLVAPKLFNENGSDSYESQSLIHGNPTGIANLNNIRYPWIQPLYRTMIGNFWTPQRVSLVEDRVSFKELTEHEEDAVKRTLAFLIFLDSFQVNNLPNIRDFITCPALKNLLTIQEFQEVIHSETYQYGLEAFYPSMSRDEIYNLWRDCEPLKKRIKFVTDIAQKFKDNPTEDAFIDVVIANLILEGLYFYNGFDFFHQLAHRNKLVQWDKEITYIQTDENTHMAIFIHIIKELGVEKYKDRIVAMFKQATEHEIEWSHFTYGDNILGISKKSSAQYAQWLCNKRLSNLNIEPIYEDVENPYKHVENASKVNASRGNFFEASAITSYDTADSVDGWDNL